MVRWNNKKSFYLDVKTVRCLKGILACMILICHIHGRIDLFDHSILGTAFHAFGYLGVSVFFFLSGYGLKESCEKKRNYVDSFLFTKLLPLYLTHCVAIVIYFLRDLIFQKTIKKVLICQSFLFGGTIVDNGWYLQALLLFYLFFFLSSKIKEELQLPFLAAMTVIYCLVCSLCGMGTTWYEASFSFACGVAFSKYKRIFDALKEYPYRKLTVLFAAFLCALYFGNKGILPDTLRIVVKMCSSVLFSAFTVFAVLMLDVKNAVTEFLGNISLEIYILQGIFLELFYIHFPIENDWLFMLLVVFLTIVSALFFYPIFKKISQIGKRRV